MSLFMQHFSKPNDIREYNNVKAFPETKRSKKPYKVGRGEEGRERTENKLLMICKFNYNTG